MQNSFNDRFVREQECQKYNATVSLDQVAVAAKGGVPQGNQNFSRLFGMEVVRDSDLDVRARVPRCLK
jgi:hypothetical protein